MRWSLWVVLSCFLMSCMGVSRRQLNQSVGPGPGPGCASSLDCACKSGSKEACEQLGSSPGSSRAPAPKTPSTPEPIVEPFLPPVAGQGDGEPDEDTKERCAAYYNRCVEAGGQTLPGRHKDESLCGSCMAYCTSNGFWPAAIYTWNGVRRRCLGG